MLRYCICLKKDIIFKILSQKLLQQQDYRGGEIFFSSKGIREIIKCSKLKELSDKSLDDLQNQLKSKKCEYALAILKAFLNPALAVRDFENLTKKYQQNYLFAVELAKLYIVNNKISLAEALIDKINDKYADNYTKAVKYYIQTIIATSAGDMESASQEASSALKLFEKEQAYFEMAMTYLRIGTIYRVSAIYDVAQFMFEAAKEIFAKMKQNTAYAIVSANLGMLMVAQNRYDEAEDFFEKALQLNQNVENKCGQAEIFNQQALMETTRENYEKAYNLAQKAKEIHHSIGNLNGEALSLDILSHIKFGQKKYNDVVTFTTLANQIYEKNHNVSAQLESLYMQASAYFWLEKYDKSEKILRKIIRQANNQQTCFHNANAYNLLGLIFLRKNDLAKAKSFFMQAVQREEKNDRFSGAAVDYANLALIEQKSGNYEQAKKMLEMALEYAKNSGDETLADRIQKQINPN